MAPMGDRIQGPVRGSACSSRVVEPAVIHHSDKRPEPRTGRSFWRTEVFPAGEPLRELPRPRKVIGIPSNPKKVRFPREKIVLDLFSSAQRVARPSRRG